MMSVQDDKYPKIKHVLYLVGESTERWFCRPEKPQKRFMFSQEGCLQLYTYSLKQIKIHSYTWSKVYECIFICGEGRERLQSAAVHTRQENMKRKHLKNNALKRLSVLSPPE